MKKILIILLLINNIAMAQQDAQYSHYMFSNTAINPGFAGSSEQVNVALLYRNQWMGLKGAPTSYLFAIDAPFNLFGINSGAGLTIQNDVIGFEKNFTANLAYAYKTDIGFGNIGLGFNFGIFNKNLKVDGEWKTPDGNSSDEALPSTSENQKIVLDLGLGVYYSFESFYLGLSTTHLNQPTIEYEKGSVGIARHYFLTGGYNIQMYNSLIDLTPSFILKSDGRTMQSDFNINVLYNKKFWGGVTYRNKDAFVLLAGTSIFSDIKIGIAYDLGISKLRKAHDNAIEVYIGYNFALIKDTPVNRGNSVRFLN